MESENGLAIMQILATIATDPSRVVMVVTHDPHILPLVDRIIHIEDGRVCREERAGPCVMAARTKCDGSTIAGTRRNPLLSPPGLWRRYPACAMAWPRSASAQNERRWRTASRMGPVITKGAQAIPSRHEVAKPG